MSTGEFRGEFKPDDCPDEMGDAVPAVSLSQTGICDVPALQASGQDGLMDLTKGIAPLVHSVPEATPQIRELLLREHCGISLGLPVEIGGHQVLGIVDSAAQITVVNSHLARKMSLSTSGSELVRLRNAQTSSFMNGNIVRKTRLKIGSQVFMWDVVVADIADDLLLGLDFLRAHKAKLDFERDIITLGDDIFPAIVKRDLSGNSFHVSQVIIQKRVVVPPNSMVVLPAQLLSPYNCDFLFIPEIDDPVLLLACTIVSGKDGEIPVNVVNDSDRHVTLKPGITLGRVEELVNVNPVSDSGPATGTPVRQVNVEEEVKGSSVLAEDSEAEPPVVEFTSVVPDHLTKLYEDSRAHLSQEESEALADLLCRYADVFARHDLDLGEFSAVQHRISTVDENPVKLRMRRTPLGFEKEEEKHLKSMLEAGVIEESNSDWCAAPVLIRKKDGTVRYCLDYRKLNAKTVKDVFPLPIIEECLDTLSGSEYFSAVDLAAGYWQIPVHPDDRHKTAFITKYGLYQHVRMPFGLCNAPATFSRAMALVLRGLNWDCVLAYLDDVVILGKTFSDHIHNLESVLQRFRKHGLKLKPRKCALCRTEIQFLGHKVDRQGIHITKSKTQSVQDWPTPTNRTEMESFLGFVNYHRNFVKGFSELAAPLYQLTGPKAVYQWTNVHEEAFRALKDAITEAPVLAFPNARDQFVLDTDASDFCLGAELSQIQEGVERPISYGSVILSPERRRYCTTRKELLAVVLFTRQFRHYLLGRQFVLRTDHGSLVWLMRFKHPEGQLARWLEELSQFDMVIEHRSGSKHQNADGLSRIPLMDAVCSHSQIIPPDLPCRGCSYCQRVHSRWARFEEDVDYVVPLALRAVSTGIDDVTLNAPTVSSTPGDVGSASHATQSIPVDVWDDSFFFDDLSQSVLADEHIVEDQVDGHFLSFDQPNWLGTYTPEDLREHQLKDPDISTVLTWLEASTTPTSAELSLSSPAVRHMWLSRRQLTVKNGVLLHRWICGSREKLKFVVPKTLRGEVLRMMHDDKSGGHFSGKKTSLRLKSSFYWYGSSVDTKVYVRSCAVCSRNKKANVKAKGPLGSYVCGGRNERVHIDLVGPFPKSRAGNRYILVIVDQFTKWFECVAIPDQSAEVVARAFIDQYISRFGPPLEIHSDQGGCFTASLFEACCKLLNITKTRTTAYRPQSNGQVERYNRVLVPMIRCYLDRGQSRWDEHLQLLAMAIRSTVNRSTGFTANMLMLGEEIRTPADITFGIPEANWSPKEPAEYVRWLREVLAEVHEEARHILQAVQRRQKRTYDLRLSHHTYHRGDFAWVLDCSTKVGRSSKLHPPWKGPVLVSKVLSPVLYEIVDRKGTHVIHHDRLKPCMDRSIPFWLRRRRHELLQLDETLPYSQDSSIVASQPPSQPLSGIVEPVENLAGCPASDLEETVAYEDPDETFPYEDIGESQEREEEEGDGEAPTVDDYVDDLGDFGLHALFEEPSISRSGRILKAPSHLRDFVR